MLLIVKVKDYRLDLFVFIKLTHKQKAACLPIVGNKNFYL